MNAQRDLVEAYHSWEQLTQAEGQAIQREDWTRVHECQRSKQGLQQQILQLTEVAQAECRSTGQNPERLQSDLRPLINSLISLESRNAEWLAGQRQAADQRRMHLDQATHNLRRVHRSYAAPSQAVWNSYS